jgi:CDP-diacylglycerol--serine O-phosphatidyltransferase
MKHLPDLLTLTNLFCGCIAIAYILTAQPYLIMNIDNGMPQWNWVHCVEQLCLGSFFIGIAAVCDLLDGITARALNVYSPIGKDLDSLADVVSFGVAPAMLLFKFLWDALMSEKNAMDVSMIGMAPAFLIPCFAALRLALFNITSDKQKLFFIGLPVPAVGLFIASLPFVSLYNPWNMAKYLQSKWLIYFIIAILCSLMVSRIKFIKLIPPKLGIKYTWAQFVLVALTLVAIPLLNVAAIPFAFILYILLSLIYKHPETIEKQ